MIDRLIERCPYANVLLFGYVLWHFTILGRLPGQWAAR